MQTKFSMWACKFKKVVIFFIFSYVNVIDTRTRKIYYTIFGINYTTTVHLLFAASILYTTIPKLQILNKLITKI